MPSSKPSKHHIFSIVESEWLVNLLMSISSWVSVGECELILRATHTLAWSLHTTVGPFRMLRSLSRAEAYLSSMGSIPQWVSCVLQLPSPERARISTSELLFRVRVTRNGTFTPCDASRAVWQEITCLLWPPSVVREGPGVLWNRQTPSLSRSVWRESIPSPSRPAAQQ